MPGGGNTQERGFLNRLSCFIPAFQSAQSDDLPAMLTSSTSPCFPPHP